jgi:predicted MFS family arabinose efflux permease
MDRGIEIARGGRIGLLVAWATLFVVGTDLFVVSPLLPLIAADYSVSPAIAGLSVTTFALSYMVSAPLLGRIADRLGPRKVLICCLVSFAAANLLTAWASNLAAFLAARTLAGSMAAGISPLLYALVAEAAPSGRRGTWLSIAVSGLLISLSLGTPIGALAGAWFGWAPVFLALAGASTVLVWANDRVWSLSSQIGAPARPTQLDMMLLAHRLSPTVLWAAALYGMYTYLGTGLAALGMSPERTAVVIVFYGCGGIAGNLAGGRLADRLGARITMGMSLAGVSVGFIALLPILETGVAVALGFAIASASAQLFFPAQQASLAEEFPNRRATALGWNNSALFFGISLGSLMGGEAIAFGGFRADLVVCAATALIGWAVSWTVPLGAARQRA